MRIASTSGAQQAGGGKLPAQQASSAQSFTAIMTATSAQTAPQISPPGAAGRDGASSDQQQAQAGNAAEVTIQDATTAAVQAPAVSIDKQLIQVASASVKLDPSRGIPSEEQLSSGDDAPHEATARGKKDDVTVQKNPTPGVVDLSLVPTAPVPVLIAPPATRSGQSTPSSVVDAQPKTTETSQGSVDAARVASPKLDAMDFSLPQSAGSPALSAAPAESQSDSKPQPSVPALSAQPATASSSTPAVSAAISPLTALPAATTIMANSAPFNPAPSSAAQVGKAAAPAKAPDAAGGAGKKSSAGNATASAESSSANKSTTASGTPSGDQATPAASAASGAGNSSVTVAMAVHGNTSEAPSAHAGSANAANPGIPDARLQHEIPETTPSSGINAASLIQSMSQTEMRVGMRSAEFGDVSIRTSVSQQQIMAQISVDHGDLGKSIAAHLPAMQARLEDGLGLRASIVVNQSGMSFSQERGQSSSGGYRSQAQPVQHVSGPVIKEGDAVPVRVATAGRDDYRLDIRA